MSPSRVQFEQTPGANKPACLATCRRARQRPRQPGKPARIGASFAPSTLCGVCHRYLALDRQQAQ
eukprot:1138976-Pleurochrysis_carterae.AAC.2